MSTFNVNSRPGAANVPPFDEVQDIRKFVVERWDFLDGIGNLTETDVAGTNTVAVGNSASSHPGVLDLTTGGTAANEVAVTTPGTFQLGDNLIYACGIVRLPNITSVEVNFGLFDAAISAGRDTESVSLEFDASNDAEWNAVTVNGGSATAVAATGIDGATVAADTWYTLEVAADANSAFFWVNGDLVTEITTNIPVATELVAGVKVATETSGARVLEFDALMVRQSVNRVGYTASAA